MKILEPIKIGKVKLKNRFMKAPMLTQFSAPDGHTTTRMVEHYRRVAAGGVGAIAIEIHFVRDDGKVCYSGNAGSPGGLPDIGDDSYIPDVARIAEAIHQEGSVCFLQMGHLGKFGRAEILPAVSGSVGPVFIPKILHELTDQQVDDYIQLYVDGAYRVKQAGCDGVMIHSAHGFFHQQFMSPYSNKREDRWGQDKMLCAVETVKRIKAKCGKDFPIVYRVSGAEYYEDIGLSGYGAEELKEMIPRLVEAGIDALDISGGTVDTPWWIIPPGYIDRGCFLHLSEAAKSVCSVPVSVVGRINDPDLAAKAVEEGKCDIVSLGRALYADPDFVKKLTEGRPEDIRKCIACNYCINYSKTFVDGANMGEPVKCAVNSALGREEEHEIHPKAKNRCKKVIIAGGGPAGMEAARVATLRGHDVTIFEKEGYLGGQLLEAAAPPGKSELANLTEYLTTQMKKLKVKVKLNTPLTKEIVEKEKPEVLIIATGSGPYKPDIAGLDRAVLAKDILLKKVEAGEKVVVIGGALVGCETAHFLAVQGKKVTICEILPQIASDVPILEQMRLIQRLMARGIEMHTGVQTKEINDKGVVIVDDGKEKTLEADTVVLAAGVVPVKDLWELKGSGIVTEFIAKIGDANNPGLILNAIHEAACIARDF
ncbi:MAG: FAD-dependent oxidoreductase [Deltaproteobacteria bacterium]|nr:MAG: FAD-dependent oxidoreductase [Deltaproteobacteria bacterium]